MTFVIFSLDKVRLLNRIVNYFNNVIRYNTRQVKPPGVLLGF